MERSTPDSPISGSVLADVFRTKSANIRRIINAARSDGAPICSSRWGYYYSNNKEHVSKTITSMRNRISAQEMAIDGLERFMRGGASA